MRRRPTLARGAEADDVLALMGLLVYCYCKSLHQDSEDCEG